MTTSDPPPPVKVTLNRQTLREMGLERHGESGAQLEATLERIGRQLLTQLSADASFMAGGAPRPLICDIGGTGPESLLRAALNVIGGPPDQLAQALRQLAEELDPSPTQPPPQTGEWQLSIEEDGEGRHLPQHWPQGLALELLRLMSTLSDPDALADRIPYKVMDLRVAYLSPGESPPPGSHVITGLPEQLRRHLRASLS